MYGQVDPRTVIHEMRLDPTLYPGSSRPVHVQAANESLLQTMEGEIAFAQDLLNQGLNLQRTPTGLAPRAAPPGFSWHHAGEPGVMQLVPRSQHDRGSIFQKTLHPNGRGGFSLWGKMKLLDIVGRLSEFDEEDRSTQRSPQSTRRSLASQEEKPSISAICERVIIMPPMKRERLNVD
ncbi:HNH endonuclease [Mesorhizobium sp. ORM16]|uniref:HNH endonuclease n=1 Tax=Mesorhizobium sp. ORM16 TaxID=3376989 RepID=UPI003857E21C